MSIAPGSRPRRMIAAVPVVVAVTVAVAYAIHALVLIRYPWDWSPDEGFYLDCAWRLVQAPSTLYGHSLVPYPCFYTPLLFALLAPLVHAEVPLAWGRLLAAGWTALAAGAAFVFVRRRAPLPLAAASAALGLAAFDLTCWHMLVRMDGPMIALWLLGAALIVPDELRRGAARMGWPRIASGAVALTAAFLAKQTAALHAAPLVLCWLWVDVRTARRLALVLMAAGALSLLLLELASGGGFSFVSRWWGSHPLGLVYLSRSVWIFLSRAWPVLLFCAAGAACCWRQGGRPWRDGGTALFLGGLIVVPALAKYGSLWSYLLPLLWALAVLGGRLWARGGERSAFWGAMIAAGLAGWLAASREFPLPDATSRRTAAAFYGFVRSSAEQRPGPILAVRPEYAYFVARQPVEVEGTNFRDMVERQAPGMERVLQRLRGGEYRLVIWSSEFARGQPAMVPYLEALNARYRTAGVCTLRLIDGATPYTFLVPRDSALRFDPPPDTRCTAVSGP